MVAGFSGFGFPKAHGAAFGLLAYQSTWLRVHYGPEFLCALLDEQPMGFYPPDALVHEAQRRGIAVLAPEVNASEVGCTVDAGRAGSRSASATCSACAREEVAALVAARHAGGPFASLEDLASRAGAGRAALEQLAWSGACDDARGRRSPRRAVAARGRPRPACAPAGARACSSRCALDLPAPPKLKALSAWDEMVADYATTGLTAATHPIGLLRPRLRAAGAVDIGALDRLGARRAGADRRPRHRAPAAGDGEGHHVPAARGRARHGQRHRLAADLRARPPHGAHRAARRRRGPPGAPCVGGRGDQRRRARPDAAGGRRPRGGAGQGLLDCSTRSSSPARRRCASWRRARRWPRREPTTSARSLRRS